MSCCRAVKIVFGYAGKPAAAATVAAVCAAAVLPLQTVFLKKVIDAVMTTAGYEEFVVWLALYPGILLAGLAAGYVSEFSAVQLKSKLAVSFDHAILERINRLPYSCFEDPAVHDVLKRLDTPSVAAADSFFAALGLLRQLLSLAGLGLVFAAASLWFLLVAAALFAVALFFNIREIGKLRRLQLQQTVTDRKAGYLSELFSDRAAAKELRLFGLGEYLLKLYGAITNRLIHERNAVRRKGFAGGAFAQVISILFVLCGTAALVLLALNGDASVAQLIALATALPPLGQTASCYLPDGFAVLRHKMQFWHDYELLFSLPEEQPGGAQALLPDTRIVFENVRFSYPGTEREILNGVSFSIMPGEKVAIAGANGCGKSTLIKLLLGLYQPLSGRITIGGRDLREYSPVARKALFGVVFQEVEVFQATVRENLFPAAGQSAGVTSEYLNSGGLLNFVSRLPGGLDTGIGKLTPGAVELSGGEKQRLVLARALLSDSRCIVLDEPTAAMDPRGEAALYENLLQVISNRSAIIVSHRLATARMAGRVLVLSDGVIGESGTHDELMLRKGCYYEMFMSQSHWYRHGGDNEEPA